MALKHSALFSKYAHKIFIYLKVQGLYEQKLHVILSKVSILIIQQFTQHFSLYETNQ